MKRALIIGARGQDGTLLADALRARGIDYGGLSREGLFDPQGRLVQAGALSDPEFVRSVVQSAPPSHVFYLAAHHHSSQDTDFSRAPNLWKLSLETQVLGLTHVLEGLRLYSPEARLFYAASSHIFGSPDASPQNEDTPIRPDNVYGATKAMGMETCRYYTRQHDLFAAIGILYNHESVYRPEKFLSQKIIQGALAIKSGRSKQLALGDLSAEVDWGYAPDYVDAMVRILALAEPKTYVIATGTAHTVRDFVSAAFQHLDLDYRDWVVENPSIIRKSKNKLVGDASQLRRETGWSPSVSFPEMVRLLIDQSRLRRAHE